MNRHDGDTIELIAMVVVWAVVMLFFFLSHDASAESDWFCTERAVVKDGTTWKACGVANAPFENTARLEALKDAKKEFVNTCDMSHDCLGHEVTVNPGRTECIKGLLGYTCRRLLVFHVLEQRSAVMEQNQLHYHPNYYMYMRSR